MPMDEFLNATKQEKIGAFANHNDSDYSAFNSFQQRLMNTYAKREAEKTAQERSKAVAYWEEKTPSRWRDAKLETINNKAARDVLALIEAEGSGNYFIKGASQAGKTYLAFAIARKYVEMGEVSPTKVCVMSEKNLIQLPRLGFKGNEKFDRLMNSKIGLYIFDDVGLVPDYDDPANAQWEQLIDHIYNNNLRVVFTSSGSAANFTSKLSTTANAKLVQLLPDSHLIEMKRDGRIAPAEFNDWNEEERGEVSEKASLQSKFSKSRSTTRSRK